MPPASTALPSPSRSRSPRPIRSERPARGPTDTRIPLPQLKGLLLHLAAERGLAVNSLHAYRRDLEDIERYFNERQTSLVTATALQFREYLQDQTRKGQSTKTVARRLAAIRVFLRFL